MQSRILDLPPRHDIWNPYEGVWVHSHVKSLFSCLESL